MSWKIVKLGSVISHRKEFITINDSEEYKRCRVQVNRKGVVLRDVVKGSAINTKKQQVCKAGDFLVAEIDAKVGGYGFVPEQLEGAIVSSHYFLFDVDESKMLKSYLAWLIKTDIIQEQINSKGSTNYAAIRPKNVLDFEIPLPSTIQEQEAIVDKLNSFSDHYLEVLKELGQQQSYLQLLRQTILQEAVQGKLTKQDERDEPASELLKRIKAEKQALIKEGKLKKEKDMPPITEEEIPFELPKGWEWCRLGDVCIKIGSGSTPRGGKDVYTNSGVKFIRSQNVYNDGLVFDNVAFIDEATHKKMEGTKVIPNDLLLNITGGSIGRCALVPENFDEANVNQHVTIIRTITTIKKEYIHQVIVSPYFQEYIMATQTGGNREGLAKKNMELMLIPLPPLAEQQRIVTKVQQLQQQLNNLEAQVQQSQQYAQQLLQTVLKEAFAGKEKQYEVNEELSLAVED